MELLRYTRLLEQMRHPERTLDLRRMSFAISRNEIVTFEGLVSYLREQLPDVKVLT